MQMLCTASRIVAFCLCCSTLPKPVKDFVQLIFDIEQFKRTLCM